MLKYIRSIFVVFLFSSVFSLAFISQAHAAQININSADAATLAQSISGIGPSKAQAIVDYREANGPFASLDDLVRVQGIGSKTLDSIREFIVVTPASSGASLSPASESPAAGPALLPN